MSIRKLAAGTGYDYLLRSIAKNDAAAHLRAPSLAYYYAAKGTPPGTWMGNGLAGFNTATVKEGYAITENQMWSLFGQGLHPDAEDQWMLPGATVDQLMIGKAFYNYTGKQSKLVTELKNAERLFKRMHGAYPEGQDADNIALTVGRDFYITRFKHEPEDDRVLLQWVKGERARDGILVALKKAEDKFKRERRRFPTLEERNDIAINVGFSYFVDAHGRHPDNDKELIDWVNDQRARVGQTAVAGYDMTFSPSKSVSLYMAFSDDEVRNRVVECHQRAVREVLEWAEDELIRCRRGNGGRIQSKTRGLIAAEFIHWDTRAHDPDLHSHVVVSNKIQDAVSGKWLSIDGRMIYQYHQAMAFRYNSVLRDILTRELGVEFVEKHRGEDKASVWEIAGVDDRLIDFFSKRRNDGKAMAEEKIKEFTEKHGRPPTQREINALWQDVILQTRQAKEGAHSLVELQETWHKDVVEEFGEEAHEMIQKIKTATVTDNTSPLFTDEEIPGVIDRVLHRTLTKRDEFQTSHLEYEAANQLMRYRFESSEHRNLVHKKIIDTIVESYAIELASDEPIEDLPAALLREDGVAIDNVAGWKHYTLPDVLAAEQAVLDACSEETGYRVSQAAVDRALDAAEQERGFALNTGQTDLVQHFLNAGTRIASAVGPAGTGKSASMKVVADAWKHVGMTVVGLAPSAAAAEVLGDELGIQGRTIDSFVLSPGDIKPGSMIIVDEAGMASSTHLGEVLKIAHEKDAVVRLVGDPLQLAAVERGGLFSTIIASKPHAELDEVMRFGDDKEQAEISKVLRRGHKADFEHVWDFYSNKRPWAYEGSRSDLLDQVVQDYLGDTAQGLRSLIIATTNEDVTALNLQLRDHYIEIGKVDTSVEATIRDGLVCGKGDTILVRRNHVFDPEKDPGVFGRVLNGDLLTVEKVRSDGSVVARQKKNGKTQVLPKGFLERHVQLGYASTVHRAQGSTVDRCRAIVDMRMDRPGLYVALTRGKLSNECYVVTDPEFDPDAEDAHYHYVGDHEITAEDVFRHAYSTFNPARSALDTMQDEIDRLNDPDRPHILWTAGYDMLLEDFTQRYFHQILQDNLPADYYRRLTLDYDFGAVRSAWESLYKNGIDPRERLQSACRSIKDWAEAPPRALNWALLEPVKDRLSRDVRQLIAYDGMDAQLFEWLSTHTDLAARVRPESTDKSNDDTRASVSVAPQEMNAERSHSEEPVVVLPPAVPDTQPQEHTPQTVSARYDIMDGSYWDTGSMAHMDYRGVQFDGVDFINVDFTGTNFADAHISNTNFQRCVLDGTNFAGATLENVSFDSSSSRSLNLEGAKIRTMWIRDCAMAAVRMVRAIADTIMVQVSKIGLWDVTDAEVSATVTADSTIDQVVGDSSRIVVETQNPWENSLVQQPPQENADDYYYRNSDGFEI